MDRLELPLGPLLNATMERVARGAVVSDAEFDAIYPEEIRRLSAVHWTPFEVAVRALELLELDERSRVLDVGSGVGKLCLIGALRTRATFVGIEQRDPLVALSREVSAIYGATRASYIAGSVEDLDWQEFQGLYFYNPFGECLLAGEQRITFEAELSVARYDHLVSATRRKLEAAPLGTRVVTFHGLGGPMPIGWRCVASEDWVDGVLKCWVRDDRSSWVKAEEEREESPRRPSQRRGGASRERRAPG